MMEKYLNKAAGFIYDVLIKKDKGIKLTARYLQTSNMLMGLHPGQERQELLRRYYTDKIGKIILTALVAMVLIAVTLVTKGTDSIVDDEGRLARRDYGMSSYNAELVAVTDENEYEIDVTVKERVYTKEETDRLFSELCPKLEEILKGENSSLSYVTKSLKTVGQVDGYPFRIRWESRDYSYLHEDGSITDEVKSEEGTAVELLCVMTYEDYSYEHIYNIVLFPEKVSPDQEERDEIIASIHQMQDESGSMEYLSLPKSVGGKSILWREVSRPTSAIMAILSVIALIGIWWGIDNDLAKKYEKRDQFLRLEYSEFVSKLQLLISSGMTLRGAFERMGADYRLALKEKGEKKYVYEELLICLKRLRDGASEMEVYTLFGNRCGQIAYKKLMTLLTQNLRKGTGKVVEALAYETGVAFEEQKRIARRMGDEAQTKLLFPMIIMLSIVMIIIMIPAYFSFGA